MTEDLSSYTLECPCGVSELCEVIAQTIEYDDWRVSLDLLGLIESYELKGVAMMRR